MNNLMNLINTTVLTMFLFSITSCDKDDNINPVVIPNYCTTFKTELESLYNKGIRIPDSLLRKPNATLIELGFMPILPLSDDCISVNQYQNAFDTTHINLLNEFSYLNLNPNTLASVTVPLYVKVDDCYSINNNILNIIILSYLKSDTSHRLVFDFRGLNDNIANGGGVSKLKWNINNNRPDFREYETIRITTENNMNSQNMSLFQFYPFNSASNRSFIKRSQFIKSDKDGYYEVINNNSNPLYFDTNYSATELLFKTAPGTSYNWDNNRQLEWFHDVLNKTKEGFYFRAKYTTSNINFELLAKVTLD